MDVDVDEARAGTVRRGCARGRGGEDEGGAWRAGAARCFGQAVRARARGQVGRSSERASQSVGQSVSQGGGGRARAGAGRRPDGQRGQPVRARPMAGGKGEEEEEGSEGSEGSEGRGAGGGEGARPVGRPSWGGRGRGARRCVGVEGGRGGGARARAAAALAS